MISTLAYDSRWLRLDNAAKIYPVVATEKNSGVFRVAAVLNELIDQTILFQAVEDSRDRFPSFFVKLHQGFFWFYYEPNLKPVIIRNESPYICDEMNAHKNNGYLFKFLCYENRISLEVFHSLSDGTGAFAFLKAVVFRYLELKGKRIINDGSILSLDDRPTKEELEDSYNALYTKKKRLRFPNPTAYRIKGKKFKASGGIGLIGVHLQTDALKLLAKRYDATISEFLVGVLCYSIIQTGNQKQLSKHPLRISVPVNMRRFLYSNSLRNFSLFFNTILDTRGIELSFETILSMIQDQFKHELTVDRLQDRLNENVQFEKNFMVKILPLVLKKMIFKIGYNIIGNRPSTISLTNFGDIKLPELMKEEVQRFEFNLASGKKPGVAVNTYNNRTNIIFNRCFKSTELERVFVKFLVDQGLKIQIDSNHWQ
jgi:NRPS condensation-like uncharacterized protein